MKIVSTPPEFLLRSIPGDPSRTRGRNCEEAFLDWALEHADEIVTDRLYLPVQWWQCAVRQAIEKDKYSFDVVPAVQAFLDDLDPHERYLTVSRGDDGIYERLPPDTIVFSVGDSGDMPVPLLPPIL